MEVRERDPNRDDRLVQANWILESRFGHAEFRPAQRPVVRAMLHGDDVLAVLPTGAGKSACFQIPALMGRRPTLVVSPLISLMEDQVAGLRRRGIQAGALTSTTPRAERERIRAALRRGALRLLYASPERLEAPGFVALARRLGVDRLVVDEAHCISEWGHDFRPAYRRIRRFAEQLGRPPVAAFTATATPRTRTDIVRLLDLRRPRTFLASVDRPNLRWGARRTPGLAAGARSALAEVRAVLRSEADGAAVVYARTRGAAVRMAEALRRLGARAAPYHAGMPGDLRRRLQEEFLGGGLRVICATSAFGMGIDHPRIRLVCHLGMPGALESYVQEAGRAGRDGEPARCLLLGLPSDRRLHARQRRSQWPKPGTVREVRRAAVARRPPMSADALARLLEGRLEPEAVSAAVRVLCEQGFLRVVRGSRPGRPPGPVLLPSPDPGTNRLGLGLRRVLARGRRRSLRRERAMRRYLLTRACRRSVIARYFGERPPACSGCDNCGR